MKVSRKKWNGGVPFLIRLQKSFQVCVGVFVFCTCSILGISAIGWLVLVAIDPQHKPLMAALVVARFSRIPWGITTGLAIFFAAVNWQSTQRRGERLEVSEISVSRRLAAIEKRLGLSREREVSQPKASGTR
jgi:hypothetical protein